MKTTKQNENSDFTHNMLVAFLPEKKHDSRMQRDSNHTFWIHQHKTDSQFEKCNTVRFRLSTSNPSGCNSRCRSEGFRMRSFMLDQQAVGAVVVGRPALSICQGKRDTPTCSVSCSSGELLSRQGTGALKLAEPSRALGRCRSIFGDAPR